MMVISVLTVIFVIIEITFVTDVTAKDKRLELKRLELKATGIKKQIEHKHNGEDTSDALSFSDSEIVRRSLGPIPLQKYINKPDSPIEENKNRNITERLKLSVTLRDNIFYIFSYLLHGHENGLTEEQYTALHLLYDILRKRMVYVYNMLPILHKLENRDKNQQTRIILSSMAENLPPYLSCAAKFIAKEIQQRKMNLNALLRPTKSEKFNYLVNISRDSIAKSKIQDNEEEMKGYDKYSNITQKALGPVFVKLLHTLDASKEPLSQQLFGLILINLPNFNHDPVLEESIRYLYETAENNRILNWNLIETNLAGKDVYALVFSVLSKILSNPNTDTVKNAATYVYNHLRITTSTYDNPNFKYTHNLIKQDIDIGLLFSAIVTQEFDAETVHMKDRLLRHFMQNYKNKDLDHALQGFNRFGYGDPLDLLMAFLTRILNRIPASKAEILQPAAALLSALIVKKHVRTFTPFVSSEVDILVLLESLKNPDLDPMLLKLVDSVKLELTSYPRISVLLSTLIPTEKDKCLIPRQCLINTFQQIQRLHTHLPLTLTTKIQNILYILKTKSPSHVLSTQYFMIPQSADVYNMDQKSPTLISDTNNTPTEFNGKPYVWNINKYISVVDFHTQEESMEREREKPMISKSTETKKPATLNPLPRVTPTSSPMFRSKPTKSIPKGLSSEVEYSHVLESISPISQKSNQSVFPVVPKHPLKSELLEHVTYIAPHSPVSPESSEEISENTTPKVSVKEKLDSENVSAAIVLPPLIKPDRPLTVQLTDNGVPIVTTDENHDSTESELVLPEIQVLLKPPNIDNFMKEVDTPIVTQVLKPLSIIFGKNYVKKLLKNVDSKLYPTNVALLTALFKKAKNHPQVAKMPELAHLIRKYIADIEYVSPTILLPIVISSRRLSSDIVYSTFNPDDLTYSVISENPPNDSSSDMVTVPLVNPKTWLQSINPSNPYANLLPTLPKEDPFEKKIRPLKKILTREKIAEILGADFNPLLYPNKGSLLITLLRKLQESKVIQLNISLKSIIDLYISGVETPSMSTNVSENNFLKMMSESSGHWQPELTSLIYALPAAKNDVEAAMIKTIEDFLANPNLLENLHIANLPLTESRGELLHNIILKILSGKMHLEKSILQALKYYKDKVMFSDMGALPIMWMWVKMYLVKAEVKLGDMIQKTLDFDKLPYQEKLAYNNLVTYLAENSHFLQNNEDFTFEKYKTQGEFVKAFFKYLLKKQHVNYNIKKNINMLVPHVMLTGPGAISLPGFDASF